LINFLACKIFLLFRETGMRIVPASLIAFECDDYFLNKKFVSMKKVFSVSKRFLLIMSTVVLSALVLSGCHKDDDDNNMSNTYTISGNANGSQMVPSVTGNGTATISGTYNADTRVLTYTTNWTGLSGAPTSGGFYSGASGASGTIVGSPWTLGSGLASTGTFSGQTNLTADQATQLLNGGWYYSLGTATNSTGEVRGQITATQTP
jgi:hypothetical protein